MLTIDDTFVYRHDEGIVSEIDYDLDDLWVIYNRDLVENNDVLSSTDDPEQPSCSSDVEH